MEEPDPEYIIKQDFFILKNHLIEEKILNTNNLNHTSLTLLEVKVAGQEDESAIIDVL